MAIINSFSSVFLVLLQLSLLASANTKPQILSEFETILEVGNNFTVICQGNTPLKWSWPEIVDETYAEWTKIYTYDTIPVNSNYKYASRIFLHNATYPFTGYYNCFDKNLDYPDDNQLAKIYLFVKDEEHLSVEDTSVDTIIATRFSEVVIPCRPTSPDVKVELTLIDGEKIDNTTYDPKTGFKFFVNDLNDEGLYVCIFVRGIIEHDLDIYLKVNTPIDALPKPILEEISDGHTIVGEKLILECRVRAYTYVIFTWSTPQGPLNNDRMIVSNSARTVQGTPMVSQELTINKTTLKDSGVYYCNVSDHQNHYSVNNINIRIYDKDDHFIRLSEENGLYELSVNAGYPSVRWRIDINAHPEPTLFWLNNKNETISNDISFIGKYSTHQASSSAILEINNITINDFGNYTLIADNKIDTESLVLFLNVTDKPSVQIEIDDFYMINALARVKCIVAAHPKPTIQWWFKPCQNNSCIFTKVDKVASQEESLRVVSYASIRTKRSGYVKCTAKNSLGTDEAIEGLHLTDVKNGFDIFGFDRTVDFNEKTNEAVIAVGETVEITCAASVNYTNIQWYFNDTFLQPHQNYELRRSYTEYSNRILVTLTNITLSNSGYYSCRASTSSGTFIYKNATLIISEPRGPFVRRTNMDKDFEMEIPDHLDFFCNVTGIPKPTVHWFKNDALVSLSSRITLQDNNQRLHFKYTDAKDEGTYRCEAFNKVGRVTRQTSLRFKNTPAKLNKWLICAIAFLAIIVLFTTVYICIKIRNERKLQNELRIAGLANFEKGALENLNPDLGIDDQAELLPYDKKWEFPIEKLKLGKQLGSGAFGVVMKGEAKGIVDDEEVTTVAVKMVKKNAGHTYIKALASELKIMVHLGKHLNVVNLLGACTKNVAKRELLVIVEYCRFGNLQNYLLRHRDNFVDQVDPKSGHLDYMIGQDILERSYSVSSTISNSHSPLMKYAVMSFSNSSGGNQVPENMADYRENDYNGTTGKTDMTTVSMNPNTGDEVLLSNNSSVQPEWRSNYKGDYKGNVKPICTKDLLAWAFQVSRGMEYLASRRVLHGDLAARNILLTDNNVVKICDFGLAKSMYKNDNYKKKGDGPLPVKWMAIESIRDKVFSTQSDVWSFGIVLWELFSLARTPYPGMEADERLYNKLVDGYRMESPDFAPKEVYKMMLDCWQAKPILRPSFPKLAERIGSMLEDTVRKHYIDLNDPYLMMNTQRLENGQNDYLAMLSPPNFENLSSPHNYVNDLPTNEGTPGYLFMKPTIFSPRADEDRVFDFEVNNKNKKNLVEATGNELIPMLGINNESDCESSACNSPVVINSFSNPSYHLPPVVEKNQNKSEKDLVKFSDNYVNMPQSKSALKEISPFIKSDKDSKDVNYVNSSSRDWESVQL